MTPSPVHSGWSHWPQQQTSQAGYMMEAPNYSQYDPRAVTSAPLVPSTLAPQYVGAHQYGLPSMPSREPNYGTHGHYPYQYEQPAQPMQVPYARYSPQGDRPALPTMHHHDMAHQRSFHNLQLPIQDERQLSPSIKRETSGSPRTPDPLKAKLITYNKPVTEEEVEFTTPIDVMMKALQEKTQKESMAAAQDAAEDQPKSEPSTPGSAAESIGNPSKAKKYRCRFDTCTKSFSQSTHLATHERAHTGEKPYACDWQGCNRSFSQPGNLKTHRRLHTGERPFECSVCQSAFAQRGNLKAHMSTHNKSKPFECKLDNCNKCFTTRGNLKNHQNKYHKQTIHKISDWIMSLAEEDESLTATDRELIGYFQEIYKNSNKGIKGRGRDRRVSEMRMSKPKSVLCDSHPQHKMLMFPNRLDSNRIGVMGY